MKFSIVNRNIHAFYDNGWHKGTIQYNSKLDCYRVLSRDGAERYIKLNEID